MGRSSSRASSRASSAASRSASSLSSSSSVSWERSSLASASMLSSSHWALCSSRSRQSCRASESSLPLSASLSLGCDTSRLALPFRARLNCDMIPCITHKNIESIARYTNNQKTYLHNGRSIEFASPCHRNPGEGLSYASTWSCCSRRCQR